MYHDQQKKVQPRTEDKARIVLEILKEDKTVSQITTEEGIHNVLNRWKSEAVQNLSQMFVDDR